MKFKNVLRTCLLSLFMIISLGNMVFAIDFSDVSDTFWAKDTIKEMTEKNIIVGYSDGTFKPNNPVKKVEVLVVLARILGVNSPENADVVEDAEFNYEDILQKYDTYATKEIAYLLEKGILNQEELDKYIGDGNDESSMLRIETVPLIVRIMGKEEEVLDKTLVVLNYKDSESIDQDLRGYVEYLGEVGLMGMATDDNRFMPKGVITRAQIATLASRILAKLPENTNTDTEKEEPIDKPIIKEDEYEGKTVGIVQDVITDYQQGRKIINIWVTKNGEKDLQKIYISEKAEIIVDGKVSYAVNIKKDNLAVMELDSKGEAIKITAENKTKTIQGIIEKVDFDKKIVTIKEANSISKQYAIDDDVVIEKNSTEADVSDIRKGDSASIFLEYNVAKSIKLQSIQKQMEGIIDEIIISRSPKITISKFDGSIGTYDVSNSATIKIFDEDVYLYDLRLGYKVDLGFDSQEIVTIDALHQISGTISSINKEFGEVTLRPDNFREYGEDVQLLVNDSTKFIDNKTKVELNLSDLDTDIKVIASGKFQKSRLYVKELLILE